MKKRMSVILALTMAATTMFSAVPAMAKDGDVVNTALFEVIFIVIECYGRFCCSDCI